MWRYVRPHDYSEPIVIPESKKGMIGEYITSEEKSAVNKPTTGLPTCTYTTKNDCWLFCTLIAGDIPNGFGEGRLFLYIDSYLLMTVGDESGRNYTDPCGFSLCLSKDRVIEIRAGIKQSSVDMKFLFTEFSIV